LEGKTVIGTISKLIEWKGYSSIIEAAKIIIKENTNIKFLFIGTGPQENELRELIRKNNLNEYITLTGWINPSYIPSMLDIFDIGIHAAFMEPFGFVLVEAMAKGVPLVTTKTGAAAEVLTHKDNCYFATYNDPLSFADGIKWMLMNFQLREQMKSQLKNIANQYFSVERMLNEYVKLYLS
jgi:glycosyltransferase involved in cell wall biosynthesis